MLITKDIHAVVELDERETALLLELLDWMARKEKTEEESLSLEQRLLLTELRFKMPKGS